MDRADATVSSPVPEPYSPQRRTALVLTGTGTAGAYHAGVLKALHEAGVKLDIVAGRGIGVIGALFAAVDGAQRLWDEKGFWRAGRDRAALRVADRPSPDRLGAVDLAGHRRAPDCRGGAGAGRVPDRLRAEDDRGQRRRRSGRGVSAARAGGVRAAGAADLAAAAGAAGARDRGDHRVRRRLDRGRREGAAIGRCRVVAGAARADVVRPCHRSLLAGDVGSRARRHPAQGTDAGRARAPLRRDAHREHRPARASAS